MKKPRQMPFLRIAICVFLLLLSQIVAAAIVVMIRRPGLAAELANGLSGERLDAIATELMLKNQTEILLVSYGIVLLVLLLMARRNQSRFWTFTGLSLPVRPIQLFYGAAAGLSAAFWASIALNLIPWPQSLIESYAAEYSALTTEKPVLDLIAVVFAGPLTEEILFRGVIYDALCLLIPPGAAVLMQGLLFGGVHSTMIWMLYAALSGCLIGYVRKRTGSLWPCIVMHMAFNGSSYLFNWVAERYGDNGGMVVFLFLVSAAVLLLSLYGVSLQTPGGTNKKAS